MDRNARKVGILTVEQEHHPAAARSLDKLEMTNTALLRHPQYVIPSAVEESRLLNRQPGPPQHNAAPFCR